MKTQIAISLLVSMTLCGNLLVTSNQNGYDVQGNVYLQQQQSADQQAQISAQVAENAKLQAQILEAEGQIFQAQQQVSTLKAQNDELNGANAELKDKVAALTAEIGDFNAFDFQEEMNYLRGQINGLKTKIQADETKINDLLNQNQRQKQTIDQLEQAILTLESNGASAQNAGLSGSYQISGGYVNVQGGQNQNNSGMKYDIIGNAL